MEVLSTARSAVTKVCSYWSGAMLKDVGAQKLSFCLGRNTDLFADSVWLVVWRSPKSLEKL